MSSEERERYEAGAFAVHSEDTADWVCKVIAEKAAELSLVKAQYEAILTRLRSEIAEQEAHLLPHLEQWASQKLEGQKRKSLILPHGTVQFRTVKAGVKVVDKEAAFEYCQAWFPEALTTTVSLDVTAYKKAAVENLAATGELLWGIETTEAHEAFSVRFGKEKEDG